MPFSAYVLKPLVAFRHEGTELDFEDLARELGRNNVQSLEDGSARVYFRSREGLSSNWHHLSVGDYFVPTGSGLYRVWSADEFERRWAPPTKPVDLADLE